MSGIGGLFLDKPFMRKEYPHKDATVAIVLKENYGDMTTDPENAPSLLSFRNERDRTSFLATMIASSDNLEVRESAICETHFFYLANLLDCLPTVAKIHDRAVSFLHAIRVLAVKGGPIKTVTFADVPDRLATFIFDSGNEVGEWTRDLYALVTAPLQSTFSDPTEWVTTCAKSIGQFVSKWDERGPFKTHVPTATSLVPEYVRDVLADLVGIGFQPHVYPLQCRCYHGHDPILTAKLGGGVKTTNGT